MSAFSFLLFLWGYWSCDVFIDTTIGEYLFESRVLAGVLTYQLPWVNTWCIGILRHQPLMLFLLLPHQIVTSVFHERVEADEDFLPVNSTVPLFVLAPAEPSTEERELQEIDIWVERKNLLTDGYKLLRSEALLNIRESIDHLQLYLYPVNGDTSILIGGCYLAESGYVRALGNDGDIAYPSVEDSLQVRRILLIELGRWRATSQSRCQCRVPVAIARRRK